MLLLITCGPLMLVLAAWAKLYRDRQTAPSGVTALVALGLVSANAILAAEAFLRDHFRPSSLPPWENPVTLTFGILFLLAPLGMIGGLVAGARGAPAWLVWMMETASLPLFVLGVFACLAV